MSDPVEEKTELSPIEEVNETALETGPDPANAENADGEGGEGEEEEVEPPPPPPPSGSFRLRCWREGGNIEDPHAFEIFLPPVAEFKAVCAIEGWTVGSADFGTYLQCMAARQVCEGSERCLGVVPFYAVSFAPVKDTSAVHTKLVEESERYFTGARPHGQDWFELQAVVKVSGDPQYAALSAEESTESTEERQLFEISRAELHMMRAGDGSETAVELSTHPVPKDDQSPGFGTSSWNYADDAEVRRRVFDVLVKNAKGTKVMAAFESACTTDRLWAEVLLMVYSKPAEAWGALDFERLAALAWEMGPDRLRHGSVYKMRGRKTMRKGGDAKATKVKPPEAAEENVKRALGAGGKVSSFEGETDDGNFIVERIPGFFYFLFAFSWFLRWEEAESEGLAQATGAEGPVPLTQGNTTALLKGLVADALGREWINGGSAVFESAAKADKSEEVFRGFFETFSTNPRETSAGSNFYSEFAKWKARGNFLSLLIAEVLESVRDTRNCGRKKASETEFDCDHSHCSFLLLAFLVANGVCLGCDLDEDSSPAVGTMQTADTKEISGFFTERYSAAYPKTEEQLKKQSKDPDAHADSDIELEIGTVAEPLYDKLFSAEGVDKQAISEWQQESFKRAPGWAHVKAKSYLERSPVLAQLAGSESAGATLLLHAIADAGAVGEGSAARFVTQTLVNLPTRYHPASTTNAHAWKLQRLVRFALCTAGSTVKGRGAGFCEALVQLFMKSPLFFEIIVRQNKKLMGDKNADDGMDDSDDEGRGKSRDVFLRLKHEYGEKNFARWEVHHGQIWCLNALLTGFHLLCRRKSEEDAAGLTLDQKVFSALFRTRGVRGVDADSNSALAAFVRRTAAAPGGGGDGDDNSSGHEQEEAAVAAEERHVKSLIGQRSVPVMRARAAEVAAAWSADGGFLKDLEHYLRSGEVQMWEEELEKKVGGRRGSRGGGFGAKPPPAAPKPEETEEPAEKEKEEESEDKEEKENGSGDSQQGEGSGEGGEEAEAVVSEPESSSEEEIERPDHLHSWQHVSERGKQALLMVRKLVAMNRKFVDEDLRGNGADKPGGAVAERMYYDDRPFVCDYKPIPGDALFTQDEFDSFRYGAANSDVHFSSDAGRF